MILNGQFPIKFDKVYVSELGSGLGSFVNISLLSPGDIIKCYFVLKKWSWINRTNTVVGRNKKLSDLSMGNDKLRVDLAIYVYFKTIGESGREGFESDKTNKINVARSNIVSVWTQNIDCGYVASIVIPQFDFSNVSSYLLISLDSKIIEDEVDICDIKIEAKDVRIRHIGDINDSYYDYYYDSYYGNDYGQYDHVINFFQTTDRLSGYGMLGDGIVREINNGLKGLEYNIDNIDNGSLWKIRDFCKDGKGRTSDNDIGLKRLKSKIGLILNIPTNWFKCRNSKYTIGYSMFECTRIPNRWISGCNRVDRIFVPVTGNIEAFRSSGVKENIPIDVIPIGIDASIYDPEKCDSQFDFGNVFGNDIYKFLVINDNQSRKNNGMLIKAIGEEFEIEIKENKVVLVSRFCHGKKLIKDKWVHHVMRYLKDDDLVKLIHTCDCMVNISSGECGDIPILQGMAMEKPVIISEDELVHSEILVGMVGKNVAFPVKIDRWERAFCTGEYKGSKYFDGLGEDAKWIIPSYDDLKKQLRYVFDNRNSERVLEVGKNARKYILENRTIGVAIKKMLDIFDKLE